jgi:transposase
MIYAELKTDTELDIINSEIKNTKKVAWLRRLMIIKLSATEKRRVRQLSEMFGLCQPTVRKYIHTYNGGGLLALLPKSPTGRKGKLGEFQKGDWDTIFEQTPNQYPSLDTDSKQWTLQLLADYMKAYHQIQVTSEAIYYALRRTGRTTGRSKLRVGSPDPDYQVKRRTVEEMRNLHLGDN